MNMTSFFFYIKFMRHLQIIHDSGQYRELPINLNKKLSIIVFYFLSDDTLKS